MSASPYDIAHPKPAPVRPRRSAGKPVVRQLVKRLRPVSPAVRRYAAWFLEAGWDADTVAWLFDVGPEGLA